MRLLLRAEEEQDEEEDDNDVGTTAANNDGSSAFVPFECAPLGEETPSWARLRVLVSPSAAVAVRRCRPRGQGAAAEPPQAAAAWAALEAALLSGGEGGAKAQGGDLLGLARAWAAAVQSVVV